MPLLQISENAVGEPKDFTWGKDWRAIRIWKELADDDEEYLFALVTRMYSPGDFGNKKEDEWYIGRDVKYVGEKEFDVNPRSPTFSKRVDKTPEYVIEQVYDEKLQKYVDQKYAVNANKIYVRIHKAADPKIIKNYKTLVGSLAGGRKTQLIFIYESRPVTIRNQKQFFEMSVKEFAELETPKLDKIRDGKRERGESS